MSLPISNPKNKYKVKNPTIPADGYADMSILHKLLALRGVAPAEIAGFLSPNFESQIHDPFLLKDMDKSVLKIMEAMKNNEHILVYSDYDADGLPGAAVIHDFFRTISYEKVSFIAPDRHEKGFGVHESVVRPYIDDACSLIITIDCGIADNGPCEAIRNYAIESRGKDVDIIITDHHLPGVTVPDVFAIINPKQENCNYPEKMLCGAAVIYKLVCALVKRIEETDPLLAVHFPTGYEKWLLDLVGIATLSDMVPLQGENRTLAHYGLVVLRKSRRPGIVSLCESNMIKKMKMLEEDVTFTIAPRINVASRLASPELAFRLLTSGDFDQAMALAKELNTINAKRKSLVAQTMKQVLAGMREKDADVPVIVIGNPDWKPPILGLVATQLIKAHKKPVFVWGRSDDGVLKGSVRSIEGIDIVDLMANVREGLFVNRGGHAMSGGFSINVENVIDLEKELIGAFSKIHGPKESLNKDGRKIDINDDGLIIVDLEVDIKDINRNLYNEISKLSPFGVGNERPIFAIRGMDYFTPRLFGKQKEHLEIDCGHIKAIQFFTEHSEDDFSELSAQKNPLIIGQIELNQFRGASEVRIKILNII